MRDHEWLSTMSLYQYEHLPVRTILFTILVDISTKSTPLGATV